MVEQGTHKPLVGSPNLPLGTKDCRALRAALPRPPLKVVFLSLLREVTKISATGDIRFCQLAVMDLQFVEAGHPPSSNRQASPGCQRGSVTSLLAVNGRRGNDPDR